MGEKGKIKFGVERDTESDSRLTGKQRNEWPRKIQGIRLSGKRNGKIVEKGKRRTWKEIGKGK